MQPHRPAHRRETLVALAIALAAILPASASAQDRPCGGGGGTGGSLVNDNAITVPFGLSFCSQDPIIHAQGCSYPRGASYTYPAILRLGSEVRTCVPEGDMNCPSPCEYQLMKGAPAEATGAYGWCAQGTWRPSYDNGLSLSYTPRPGLLDVAFTYWYVASPISPYEGLQPRLRIVLATGGAVVHDQDFPLPLASSLTPGIHMASGLPPGMSYEVQATLYDADPCMHAPGSSFYWGGESENYTFCLGSFCADGALHSLYSLH